MRSRRSRQVIGLLALAVLALVAQRAWAVFYALGPSKDEWGLKYDVQIEDAGTDLVTIKFILADEGRLKPIHSVNLTVLDKKQSTAGSQVSIKKGRLEFKTEPDGKRVGRIQLPKSELNLATLKILTQRVDGKFQSAGAAFYDIPLAKYAQGAEPPAVAAPLPPTSGRRVKK